MHWLARHKIPKITLFVALLLAAGITCVSLRPDELTRYKARLAASGEELSLLKLSPPYSQEAALHRETLRKPLPASLGESMVEG